MNYFDRVCAIDVSPDIRIDLHKIKFEIKKSITADKNFCRVDLYNLSENTRNKITSDPNSLIRILAGYVENEGLLEIGQGNISNVIHIFKSPDIVTTIYSKDGFRATNDKRITLSFIEKTPLSSVINAIISELNLPVKFTDYDKTAQLKGGFSFIGSIPDALDQLSIQFNFKWSIQNGQLQIIKEKIGTGKRSILLSATTGMIENPELIISTKKLALALSDEYKVVSLLQPQLEAGDLIEIESRDARATGVFVIKELEHKGDNRGNEWYTTLIVTKHG